MLDARDGAGGIDAEARVIVESVVFDRPVVDDLVPLRRDVGAHRGAELEAGVIGGDVDAHGLDSRPGRKALDAREQG